MSNALYMNDALQLPAVSSLALREDFRQLLLPEQIGQIPPRSDASRISPSTSVRLQAPLFFIFSRPTWSHWTYAYWTD